MQAQRIPRTTRKVCMRCAVVCSQPVERCSICLLQRRQRKTKRGERAVSMIQAYSSHLRKNQAIFALLHDSRTKLDMHCAGFNELVGPWSRCSRHDYRAWLLGRLWSTPLRSAPPLLAVLGPGKQASSCVNSRSDQARYVFRRQARSVLFLGRPPFSPAETTSWHVVALLRNAELDCSRGYGSRRCPLARQAS